MNRGYMGLSLLIVAVAIAAQLSLFFPAAQAGQNMYASNIPTPAANVTTRRGNPCRKRCATNYRTCINFAGASTRACKVRYRNCLKKCG